MGKFVNGRDRDLVIIDENVDDCEYKINVLDLTCDRIEVDTTSIEGKVDTVDSVADSVALNRQRIFQKAHTDVNCNVGALTSGTISGSVFIEKVVLRCVAGHADVNNITITAGAGAAIAMLNASPGPAAEDAQSIWTSGCELGNGKTIVTTITGEVGANVCSYVVTMVYRPCTSGAAIA